MAPGLLQPRPGRLALMPHGRPPAVSVRASCRCVGAVPSGVSSWSSRPAPRPRAAVPRARLVPSRRSSTCPAPPPGPGRPGSGGPGTGGVLPWRHECPSDTRASPAPVGASGLWLGAGSLVTPSPSGWSVTGSVGTISARGRAVAEQVTPGACSRVQPGEQLQTPTGVLDGGRGRGGASRDLPAFALTAGLMPALPDPPCPRPSSPCPHASPRLPVCTQLPAGTWPRPRICVLCAACRGPFLLSRLPRRSLSSVFAQRCPHAGSSACTGPGPGGPRHPASAGSEPACLPAPRPPCLAHSLVAVTGHLNPAEGLGWQLQPETGSRLVPGAVRGRPR